MTQTLSLVSSGYALGIAYKLGDAPSSFGVVFELMGDHDESIRLTAKPGGNVSQTTVVKPYGSSYTTKHAYKLHEPQRGFIAYSDRPCALYDFDESVRLTTKPGDRKMTLPKDELDTLVDDIFGDLERTIDESIDAQKQRQAAERALAETPKIWTPGETQLISIGGIQTPFSYIPAGEFMMGSPEDEAGRFSDETQKHVVMPEPYFMCAYPTTQAMWFAVMGTRPSHYDKPDRGDHPVTNVSWDDVQEFIKRLNASQDEWTFSLPTEAEWEYAARAGTTTAYCYGDTIDESQANFNSDSTTPVGKYLPNNWGLYDVHGNVWEWCLNQVES